MGEWVSKEVGYGPRGSRIVCTSSATVCCAYSPSFRGPAQDADAIAAWNRRAPTVAPPEGMEATDDPIARAIYASLHHLMRVNGTEAQAAYESAVRAIRKALAPVKPKPFEGKYSLKALEAHLATPEGQAWFERAAAREGDLEVGAGHTIFDGSFRATSPDKADEASPAPDATVTNLVSMAWLKGYDRGRFGRESQHGNYAEVVPKITSDILALISRRATDANGVRL